MLSPLEKLEQAAVPHNESLEGRGPWMETFTGTQFYLLDPQPAEVHIEDIAHSLAFTCRFGGHCQRWLSVAEHSLHLEGYARNVLRKGPHGQLHALMHDAAEAYTGDIPRPLKIAFPDIKPTIEEPIERVVMGAFGLPWRKPQWLKELDERIIVDERRHNMRPTDNVWAHDVYEPLRITPRFYTPETAERLFLSAFYRITSAMESSHDS